MKDNKKKKSKAGRGFKTFTKCWAVLYLLVTAAFAGVLVYMDFLTLKYLGISGGIIVILFLLLFPALFFRNFKKSRKVIALVLSVFVMCAYGVGIACMTGTLDFFDKITAGRGQTQPYYVLAAADHLEFGEDKAALKGKTVQTFLTSDVKYSEAKNLLREELNTEYEMEEELEEMAEHLLQGETELIFVSDAHYETICSENGRFRENSRIVYTVKVPMGNSNIAKDVDVTKDSFNIYVSGLDTEGTIDVVSRSDVNMIVTVNPKTHKVLLTSVPRDYYLELPGMEGSMDKLTHTGTHGIETTVAAVEQLTGLDINYYVKVNYTTVTELIDALGGIEVESDYTFVTHGMGVYYEFYEGINQLDGARALAFARERKSFSDGDFQRNRNQQLVFEGVLEKAVSSPAVLTKYTDILNAVEDCVEINMAQKDIRRLIKMQLEDMPSWKIEKQSILGDIGSEVCYMDGLNYTASVVLQDQQSIVSAVDRIVAVMEEER